MNSILPPPYRSLVLLILSLLLGLTSCISPQSLQENEEGVNLRTPTGFFTPTFTKIMPRLSEVTIIPSATIKPTLTLTPTIQGTSTAAPAPWGDEIIPTITPGPTSTALIFQEGSDDEVCVKQPGLPDELAVTYHPFCIYWSDSFMDKTGFELILEYSHIDNIYEIFVFQTSADVTSLKIPEQYAPRIEESREQCLKRKSFVLKLYVMHEGKKNYITELAHVSQCNLSSLPTATPDS
jgi:hypothetical protein